MKSLIFASVATFMFGVAAAAADEAAPGFLERQSDGLMRAPKLVGVTVYDAQNKSVGKIDDLLIDHDGSIKAVVIGVGGFLGIGKKDVALPFGSVRFQTEQRTVATNEAPPAAGMSQTTTPNNRTATKTVDPARIEAYQGYPDRAVVEFTQAQLKAAPEFKYASNPETEAGPGPAPGAVPPTPAQKP